MIRGVYCSLRPRVAFLLYQIFIIFWYFLNRKIGTLALKQLLYFCNLVCRDEPQTNFKSSYYSLAIVKVSIIGNGTLFKLNIFMSDLVT